MTGYTWLRWRQGQATLLHDRGIGRWAARELQRLRPESCYLFTQVALESLRWCRREGIPTILDNPNGHISNYQQVCERESMRWFGRKFHGHPSAAMLERVQEEYQLADRIRVYSEWGKASMTSFGVPEDKIHILRQTVNLEHFRPPADRPLRQGPLEICYVGSLDLRKGFVYLLKAIRAVGAHRIRLRIVGATGDRNCARLLARESAGLQVEIAPGNSLPVYQASELLVIPTLEDGLPFVLVEGLACGLPVIVTREAGASECVRPGRSGWVVPAADADALAAALEDAIRQRAELPEMGSQARSDLERYAGPAQLSQLSDWFYCRSRAAINSNMS
jgi:glycosyltransferase involved in cell wall biosynthesis